MTCSANRRIARSTSSRASLEPWSKVLRQRHAEAVKLSRDGATADPELRTPAGQEVGGRGLLGAVERMTWNSSSAPCPMPIAAISVPFATAQRMVARGGIPSSLVHWANHWTTSL